MTSNTKQLRAVFLAALMVMSVFAGTVAFAGSAAAVTGASVDFFNPDNLDEGTTETHNLNVSFTGYADSAGDDYVNVTLPAGTIDDATGLTVETRDGDVITTVSSGDVNGDSLNVSFDATGTAHNDTIYLNGSMDVAAPSNVDGDVSGPISFTLTDSDGTSESAQQTVTINDADASGDTEAPEYLESVHYDADTTDDETEIEFSFSEEVNNLGDANLYLDEKPLGTVSEFTESVSNEGGGQYIATVDGSDVNTGEIEVLLTSSITDAGGNELTNTGNKTVEVAPVTVTGGEDVNAYQGSQVAVVADGTDTGIEVEASGEEDFDYFVSGSTGANSEVFVFDTDDRDIGQYNISIEGESEATVNVRDLGLEVDIDDLNITNDDEIEGTVSANAGNRPVTLELLDSDGDVVDEQGSTIAARLTGQAEYEFTYNASDLDLDDGNYTVLATDNQSGVEAESSSIVVTDAGEGRADIGGSGIITEQRGDVANITITLQNTDYATLTLGSDDVGYRSNVTVEDENGDGEVNLLFNTWAATGRSGNVENTNVYDVPNLEDDDDSITDATIEEGVDSLLESGEYDLEVRAGQSEEEDSQGVGTLTLEERNTTSIRSWTAPTGTSFDDTEELYDAVGDNNLTQSNQIAYGDMAVHQLEASGLEGLLGAQDEDEVTSEFFDNDGDEYKLTVEQMDPGANRDPYQVLLGPDNATVWADSENDTYFIIYDTDSNNLNTDTRSIEDDDTLEANFTVYEDEDNLTDVEDGETVLDEYSFVEAEYMVDEPVNVSASGEQTIMGETTVAPGTEVSLRARSSGDTQPSFLKTATVYVTENQTFSSTFDFSEQEVGDTFELTVRGGAADSETFDGNVVESVETETNMTETEMTETEMTETEMTDTETEAPGTDTEAPGTDTEAPGTDTGTEPATETGTPGFGVVVAVTALLAAALLAIRRD
ncbi:PGF-CTERM protein/surface glycoprotein [Halogeometricum rufum]|uniref:PGF-CTERM protein/surface glycoprotein n=1 Tax=Halogeometricum rufum TaxID=553469 RepID=A0A1I6HT08_9EURY|nr:BGTF surface domain-containing protein [Halogeometricum rufum]SFR57569.1 PGF-CTERM protein/surface glycoprotein [Halogeometricum rufum]